MTDELPFDINHLDRLLIGCFLLAAIGTPLAVLAFVAIVEPVVLAVIVGLATLGYAIGWWVDR